jgi:2-polyprenyl-6-methoxyphenol hydroxylase-like FAD-dependent oxidoreductase
MSRRRYRILMIGAGVAGLSAAIALCRTGHEVKIFERQPEVQPLGAGLVLWSNAIEALKALGLAPEIARIGHPLSQLAILDQHGAILTRTEAHSIATSRDRSILSVHRGDLLPLLIRALPSGVLHPGKELTNFEQSSQGVTAHFADGSRETGDVLIGADGIWSTVRAQLHGDQPARYSGYTAWRAIAHNFDPQLHFVEGTTESWGNGLRFGWVPLSDNRVYWFAVKNAPEGQRSDQHGHRSELLTLFGTWHPPIRETILATIEEDILRHDIYDRPPISRWGAGATSLAGDAAHPMTPNTGQGAAQAIEDAVVLADCLSRYRTIDGALRAYENTRHPRTRMVTELSQRIGSVAQLDRPAACHVRNLVARMTPDSIGRRQLTTIVNWTPPALKDVTG